MINLVSHELPNVILAGVYLFEFSVPCKEGEEMEATEEERGDEPYEVDATERMA